jgi:uncharacterized membrane protein YdjX (TVP38/TMEM64 family)
MLIHLPILNRIHGHHFSYVYHPIVTKLSISLAALGLLMLTVLKPSGREALAGIQATLADQRAWAALLLAFLFVVSTLSPFFPEFLVTVAAGFIFGVELGSAFSVVLVTLVASANFLVGRHLGPFVLQSVFDPHSAREIRWTITRITPTMVFMTWLLPSINFDLISYAAGHSPMAYRTFLPLTISGNLLSSVLLAFLGANVRSGAAVTVVTSLILYTLVGIVLYAKELPSRFAGLAEPLRPESEEIGPL